MKILFTIAVLDVGGAELAALNLALKLKEKGHDLIIFNANEKKINKQLIAKFKPSGIPIHSIKDWSITSSVASKANSLFRRFGFGEVISTKTKVQFVRSLIKTYNVDIVCSHAPTSDIICQEAVKNLNVPLVMMEHGRYSYFLSQGKKHRLKPLLSASNIIAVSQFCNQQIKSYVGDAARVTTIYNGIEIKQQHSRAAVRSKLGIQDGDIAFGLVARGKPKKGWQAAIDGFLQLQKATDKKVHLVLVGGSDYVDELKAQYAQHAGIHFVGKVPNATYFTEGIDVGLMLSTYKTEALSLTAIEFLMLGKPVIATHVGGVPEVLQYKDVTFGSLIELQEDESIDTEQLKNEMLRFTNGEKSLVLDPKYIDLTLKRFSMDASAQAYETFFESLLTPRKKTLARA